MGDAEVWVDRHRQSGTPCVHGTRIPTRIVAGLVPDMGIEGVQRMYPTLTDKQIEAAVWYEATYGDDASTVPDESNWGVSTEPRLGVGYVYLNPGVHDHTVALSDSIHVDVSTTGEIMGVEILNLRREGDAR